MEFARSRAIWAALALLVCVYLLQMLSPLRVNTDAITLLTMAASAADGEGFVRNGSPTQFPPGYPALVVGLEWAGLAAPWALVAMNLVFLFLGIGASYFVLRRALSFTPLSAAAAGCLTLLSFALVKYATLPITDTVFFGLALCTLAVLVRAQEEVERRPRRALLGLGVAGGLMVAATTVRTAGIALIPAALWLTLQLVLVARRRQQSSGPKVLGLKRSDAVLLLLAVIGTLGTALYVVQTRYFAMATRLYSEHGVLTVAGWNAPLKLLDWGELALNIPIAKGAEWIDAARPLWMMVGVVGLCVFVYGLWRRRRRFGVVEVFVLSYLGVLAFWVSKDVRFWMPVIPLIIALVWCAVRPHLGSWRVRWVLGAYVAWFVVAGLMALAYSTRISLAGAEFPRLYGGGSFQASYEFVLHGRARHPERIDDRVVRLLERYGGFGNQDR